MDKSVENFYTKNADQNYAQNYDRDHGKRLDFVIKEFALDKIKSQKIIDFGCGLGNYFKRMDSSNKFFGLDGAIIPKEMKLCEFESLSTDLNTKFSDDVVDLTPHGFHSFDLGICSETLEHLTDPYTCLDQIKKLVKFGSPVIITIPSPDCWHNYIYPALMYTRQAFEQFLEQMALQVVEYKEFTAGWQCHCWKVINKPYCFKKMLFEKSEEKFLHASPLWMVNL